MLLHSPQASTSKNTPASKPQAQAEKNAKAPLVFNFSVNQGHNFFYSSSKHPKGDALSWSDEPFLLTLNSGYEALLIQLHQHVPALPAKTAERQEAPEAAGAGNDSILDSLELRLDEVLLELVDQEPHSMVRLGRKNSAFELGLRWTFEENVSKVQELKKQLAALVEQKHKDCLLYTSPSPRDS